MEFDDNKFKEMKQSLDVLNKDLKQTVYSYNDNSIDNKNYDFFFKQKIISSVFGRLLEVWCNFNYRKACIFTSLFLRFFIGLFIQVIFPNIKTYSDRIFKESQDDI